MKSSEILIEGLKPNEILALEDLEGYAATGRPIVISVGAAHVLAEFSIKDTILLVEIAVVEDGGEGVLPALIDLVEKAAGQRRITAIEWSVLARNCAVPNPKLMRVLERIGFEVRKTDQGMEYYWQRRSINDTLLNRHCS